MMESSPTTIASLLLRNLVTSIFIHADKSLLNLAQKYKLLEYIRYILATSFLFFSRFLPSLFPSLNLSDPDSKHPFNPPKNNEYRVQPTCGGGDSGIARALSQLLSIINDIPVSSRKYEVVRSLAETLIDENHRENVEALREVNRTVLLAAFSRTLNQLEATMVELGRGRVENGSSGPGQVKHRFNQVLKAIRYVGDGTWARAGRARDEVNRSGSSGEKLAAELLWLAQKLVACGCGEEAVWRWASASNLAWLSLSAEPRLQGSLVKVSGMFFHYLCLNCII